MTWNQDAFLQHRNHTENFWLVCTVCTLVENMMNWKYSGF